MTEHDKVVKVIIISMLCYIIYVIRLRFNKWKKKIKKDRLRHNHSTTNTCFHKHDDIIHIHNLQHEHIFDDTRVFYGFDGNA